ncbi:5563_t:CDS:2 [Racocetra persica]|uniref:5563_t:CDS:1 n=1 Tax=Racocetra persica TaxID=160502 RepID=A0ACA9L9Y1_9GLOM|nr:5563_t:CDS:2 [Racocetra persica]
MPRQGYFLNLKNNVTTKILRSDKQDPKELRTLINKLIDQRQAFILRQLNRNEISTITFNSENLNLKNLKVGFDSLISKIVRLENNEKAYQNEISKFQEKNIKLQEKNNNLEVENNQLKCSVDAYQKTLEDKERKIAKYYNVIEKTQSVLQNAFQIDAS